MRKKVIAVRGQPNSGKTTAIKLAFAALAGHGKISYSNPRHDATELKSVLEIDGVLVGFASAGDMPDRLARTLQFLLEHGCVVIICAARLNRSSEPAHKTVDALGQFCDENGYELEWIDKVRNWDARTNENSQAAAEIVAKVRTAIRALAPAGSAI